MTEQPAGAPGQNKGEDTNDDVAPRAARLWRSRRLVAGAIAAFFVIAAAGAYFLFRAPLVETVIASRGEAADIVYATGVVEYVRQARIAPVVTAPIRRVYGEEGSKVRQGALLVQLEDGPSRGTALQLESQASTARISAVRVERLYQHGYASRSAWDEARGLRDAANAAAQSARARLSDYAITAPFAGTVLRREAEPGDQAVVGKVLFVIADQSSLRVTADLDERDIARVAMGQSAIIRADAFAGQTFDAAVAEVTPQGDSATRVFRVRLKLPADAPLRAGMTVEANIIAGHRADAILVPTNALRADAVFVVKDGRTEQRTVVRGATGADKVEIRQGVAEGETVVINPPETLHEGARVRTRAAK